MIDISSGGSEDLFVDNAALPRDERKRSAKKKEDNTMSRHTQTVLSGEGTYPHDRGKSIRESTNSEARAIWTKIQDARK